MADGTDISDRILSLPPLRTLVDQTALDARKSLGQNFIFDLNLTQRIARTAAPFTGSVFEIGPGPGGLTRALFLEGASDVTAIEKDRRVISFLDHLVAATNGQLKLIEADALTQPVWEMGQAPRKIVANLPYNIATALLLGWLEHAHAFASMTLMFQREVAMRLVAQPDEKAYGRLSVITQWLCEAELKFDIPPQAFVPPPKVTSSVVHLVPRSQPLFDCRKEDLEAVTAIAFGQRRKMLRASFKKYGGEAMLTKANIDPSVRPQQLSIEAFCRLARYMHANQLLG
ncbi:MAG: 16S rRNA (adenine(1518)-N(6)/adenine(1519)-N(6))-dimethyltransferase RsmA [Candidatus Puniceispirillaceae bacterium]